MSIPSINSHLPEYIKIGWQGVQEQMNQDNDADSQAKQIDQDIQSRNT